MPAPESAATAFRRLVANAQVEGRLPSLSAAVFRGTDLIWAEAVGLADVEAGREATPDTQYPVASITKTFTAAAIMRLRDEGRLGLDDPLSAHIPEAAHAGLTLRRMLSHLSGLQREPAGEVWESLAFPTTDELLARLGEAEQVLPPAAAWHYSNLAYALLGEVVARAAETPYERFVEERFLEPLGLSRTSWSVLEPAARGYFVEPYADAVKPEPAIEKRGGSAAGALRSTTLDLARWGAFLVEPDPELLSPASAEEMRAVQTMEDAERWTSAYGLGLQLGRRGDRVFAGHTGGFPGFVSMLVFSPAEKIGVAMLANATKWRRLTDVGLDLVTTALDELAAAPEPWRPGDETPAEVAGVLGRWWSESSEWIFSYRDGRLEARAADAFPERGPSVFEPLEPDLFRTVAGHERGELLRIVRDESGEPVKLYWATYPFLRTARPFGPA